MLVTNGKDKTHYGKKITVLREYGQKMYCVCSGNSFYGKGLKEKYQVFSDYIKARDYFNIIAR